MLLADFALEPGGVAAWVAAFSVTPNQKMYLAPKDHPLPLRGVAGIGLQLRHHQRPAGQAAAEQQTACCPRSLSPDYAGSASALKSFSATNTPWPWPKSTV